MCNYEIATVAALCTQVSEITNYRSNMYLMSHSIHVVYGIHVGIIWIQNNNKDVASICGPTGVLPENPEERTVGEQVFESGSTKNDCWTPSKLVEN